MSRPSLLLIPVLFIALLPACKDQAADSGKADGKSATKVEPGKAEAGEPSKAEAGEVEQPKPATPEPAQETGEGETGEDVEPAPALPAEFDQVGFAACDEYVATYVACINDKVPEDKREALRRIVFEQVGAWKQMAASGPSAEKALEIGCKSAREQAKRTTQEWGCTW